MNEEAWVGLYAGVLFVAGVAWIIFSIISVIVWADSSGKKTRKRNAQLALAIIFVGPFAALAWPAIAAVGALYGLGRILADAARSDA